MTAPATALAVQDQPSLTPFQVIEKVITQGDLAKMTPAERVAFYWRTCESLGLNPLTRPFEFINLNGKLVMYARKDATDQLRKINGVSVTSIHRDKDDELGLLTVVAGGRDLSGREDEATGVVSIKGLSGEALANAVMKAETKAKRRLTLSLVGLGFLDESEVEGGTADVDPMTGEILERPKPRTLLESVNAQKAAMATAEAPPADDAPAAAEPDAEPAWTQPVEPPAEPAGEPSLLERLRTNAEASGLAGDMTAAQQAALVDVLTPLKGVVGPGVALAFGKDAKDRLTAAQAAALANVAGQYESLDAFAEAWRAMLESEAPS